MATHAQASGIVYHLFTANYPHDGSLEVLSLHARMDAASDYSGRGVVVAFLDSGFYPHPDLRGRIIAHVDAVNGRITRGDHFFHDHDFSWHGQMTSVLACGDGRLSDGKYRGLAHRAQVVLIKVTSYDGQIKEADILRGLVWVLRHHRAYRIRVLTVAVGGDDVNDDPKYPIYTVIKALTEQGVTVLCAAGNRGVNQLVPPASAPEAITVGGVDDRNSRRVGLWQLFQHSYGTAYDNSAKPELLAPAAWLPSPILPYSTMAREARWLARLLCAQDEAAVREILSQACPDFAVAGVLDCEVSEANLAALQARIEKYKIIDAHHQHVDGTSVAVAVAAAVVAQMLEANPRLSPRQIRQMLQQTAVRLPDVPSERQGAGILNAAAAVRAAAHLGK